MSTSGTSDETSYEWEEYLRGYNDGLIQLETENDDLRERLLNGGFSALESSRIIATVRGWLDARKQPE